MFLVILKYFSIIFCRFFAATTLLPVEKKKEHLYYILPFTLILSTIIYYLREYIPQLSIFVMITLFSIFTILLLKQSINKVITTSIISFGISYVISTIAALIFIPVLALIIPFVKTLNQQNLLNDIYNILVFAMQFPLTVLLLKNKRLRNGIIKLTNLRDNDFAVFICIIIMIVVSFFYHSKQSYESATLAIFFICLSGILLFFWWKSNITQIYNERIRQQELYEAHERITLMEKEIDTLKVDNDFLAKTLHRDNKIIPAMVHAVENALLDTSDVAKITELLSYIISEQDSREYQFFSFKNEHEELNYTDVVSINSLIKYMVNRAAELHIILIVDIQCDINYMLENIIDTTKMSTLIADLLDNAIVAVS